MALHIEDTIHINAAPEVVTRLSTNPLLQAEWFEGCSVFDADDDYPVTGSTGTMQIFLVGAALELRMEVLEYIQDEYMHYSFHGDLSGEGVIEIFPEGDDTLLRWQIMLDESSAAQWGNPADIKGFQADALRKSLVRLRDLIEQG